MGINGEQIHFKLYKSGKCWIVAALMCGVVLAYNPVKAHGDEIAETTSVITSTQVDSQTARANDSISAPANIEQESALTPSSIVTESNSANMDQRCVSYSESQALSTGSDAVNNFHSDEMVSSANMADSVSPNSITNTGIGADFTREEIRENVDQVNEKAQFKNLQIAENADLQLNESAIYTPEQQHNAKDIFEYFTNSGWTANASAGLLGNIVSESGLIPDVWEGGHGPGYGLVQWTPADNLIAWCKDNGLDYTTLRAQCQRIAFEMTHGQQFFPSKFSSMTAAEYMNSTLSPEQLALIFLNNYERPANSNQPQRSTQARYWYDNLALETHAGQLGNQINHDKKVSISGVYKVDQLLKYNNNWYVVNLGISVPPVDYNNYIPVGPLVTVNENGQRLENQTLNVGSYFTFDTAKYPVISDNTQGIQVSIGNEPVWLSKQGLQGKLTWSGFGDDGKYYNDGKLANGLITIDDKLYDFQKGLPLTGIQTIAGKIYLFDGQTDQMKKNFLYQCESGAYYFGDDGQQYRDRFYFDSGKMYYFGADGVRFENKFYKNWGNTYYFGNAGVRATDENLLIGTDLWQFDKEGIGKVLNDGIFSTKNGLSYLVREGRLQTGEQTVGDDSYYFDTANYAMKKNFFFESNGKGYYFAADGKKYRNGLFWTGTFMYYFDSDGVEYQNKFYQAFGHTYFFKGDGKRATTEDLLIDNQRWHFDGDGVGSVIKDGLLVEDNGTTFDYQNGQQQVGEQTVGSDIYYFDPATHQMKKDYFFQKNGKMYYFGSDGKEYRDKFYYNWGKEYYFGPDGARYTDQFYSNWGHTFYFGDDGAEYKGQFYYNWGNTYYFGLNGARVDNQTITIDGQSWRFDNDGVGTKIGKFVSFEVAKQGGINGFTNNEPTYIARQCTSFVAGALAASGIPNAEWEHLGNAGEWAAKAKAKGLAVDRTPIAGSVVCFGPASWNGGYGHVAYITNVNTNGSVHIIEGNFNSQAFHERDIWIDSSVSGIIHF